MVCSLSISKSAVCEFMRIDWKTVGRCVSRALHDIEPDLSEYSHEIAPLVANSAPPILTDEHHLIA